MKANNASSREPVGASLLANGLAQELGLFASKDWGVPLAPTVNRCVLEALS